MAATIALTTSFAAIGKLARGSFSAAQLPRDTRLPRTPSRARWWDRVRAAAGAEAKKVC
jgi:hypothetical protein